LRRGRLVIEQRRGGRWETGHPVSAVLVDSDGGVVEQVGEDVVSPWRSAAKPFQLEVSAGLLNPKVLGGLDPRDLALGAASHSGEPAHTQRVLELLRRLGCDVEDLYCGTHWPLREQSGRDLLRHGEEANPLHNNCSGKHTFMAAAARAHGWPSDYRDPNHPLQQRIRANIEARTAVSVGAVVDGCGVPCWVLPVSGMARAWAQLAAAMKQGETSLLGRIGWAMQRNPFFASGTVRSDGAVMEQSARPAVAKIGAEGLMCGSLSEDGLGFALKVHTGNSDARAIATFAVLERWFPGLLPSEASAPWTVVRNVVARPIGERVAVWDA